MARFKQKKTQLRVLADGRKLMFSLCWYENERSERISQFFIEDSGINGVAVESQDALDLLLADGYDVSKVPIKQ